MVSVVAWVVVVIGVVLIVDVLSAWLRIVWRLIMRVRV